MQVKRQYLNKGPNILAIALLIIWIGAGFFISQMAMLGICLGIASISMVSLGILISTGRAICAEMEDFRPHRFGNIYFAYPDVLELMTGIQKYTAFCFWLRSVLRITIIFTATFIVYLGGLFISQN